MKILVVGAGRFGRNHIRICSEIPFISKVLVVKRKPATPSNLGVAPENARKVELFSSIEEALKKHSDVRAGIVATPTERHHIDAMKLIERGIHLFVEKPLAVNPEESRNVVEAAEKKKLILMPGHIEIFNPAVQALKNNLRLLGQIKEVAARRFEPPHEEERGLSDVFTDLGIHDLYVISHVFQEHPESVKAFHSEKHIFANYKYRSFNAVIRAKIAGRERFRQLEVKGSKAKAVLDYITQVLYIVSKTGETLFYFKPSARVNALKEELKHFLECVRTGKRPSAAGEEGLRAVVEAHAGLRSAEERLEKEIP